MSRRLINVALVAALAISAQAAAAQHLAKAGPIANLPAPVALDTTGMFQAKFVRLGDDIFIGGQPTEKALRDLKAQGVTVVVNLRTPKTMSTVHVQHIALIAGPILTHSKP